MEESSFRNDCSLLLQLVIHDAQELADMLNDSGHSRWGDKELDEQFQRQLGNFDYKLCDDMLKKISELLADFRKELSSLEATAAVSHIPMRHASDEH